LVDDGLATRLAIRGGVTRAAVRFAVGQSPDGLLDARLTARERPHRPS
jgi:hypothetical protein